MVFSAVILECLAAYVCLVSQDKKHVPISISFMISASAEGEEASMASLSDTYERWGEGGGGGRADTQLTADRTPLTRPDSFCAPKRLLHKLYSGSSESALGIKVRL